MLLWLRSPRCIDLKDVHAQQQTRNKHFFVFQKTRKHKKCKHRASMWVVKFIQRLRPNEGSLTNEHQESFSPVLSCTRNKLPDIWAVEKNDPFVHYFMKHVCSQMNVYVSQNIKPQKYCEIKKNISLNLSKKRQIVRSIPKKLLYSQCSNMPLQLSK